MPGNCVACHGGNYYAGHYPTDGTGTGNIGAHFLPFDTANFAFSSAAGLGLTDQAAQVHALNHLVLGTNATLAETNLINGWYASGSNLEDKLTSPAPGRSILTYRRDTRERSNTRAEPVMSRS